MPTEREIIALIARAFRARRVPARGVIAGIGDDAAILRIGNAAWAISTDAFIEDTHFLSAVHAPEIAGYKALARSVSDLAAVGATPRFFLLNLALPRARSSAWLRDFSRGMARAARRFRIQLIGGDTTPARKACGVSANLCVLGEIGRGLPILRSGARPGDIIFVSGTTGAAQLGLALVLRELWRDPRWRPLLRRHLRPEPRIELGKWLAGGKLATAMIDTSDGLSTDVANLCAASNVGALVSVHDLPAVRVPLALQNRGFDAEAMALHGGDDYELLFTVAPRNLRRIPKHWKGVPLTVIGKITREKTIFVEKHGKKRALRHGGWDPFR